MRHNIVIVLLSVCATLLSVQVVSTLNNDMATPVFGQTVGTDGGGAGYVMATGMSTSGSNNMLYILEPKSGRVAAYTVQSRGIEYKGTRQVTHDLIPEELTPKGRMTVSDVRKALKKLKRPGGK